MADFIHVLRASVLAPVDGEVLKAESPALREHERLAQLAHPHCGVLFLLLVVVILGEDGEHESAARSALGRARRAAREAGGLLQRVPRLAGLPALQDVEIKALI
eukprot:1754099-Pleurochrysis_carterae.AAC.2